MSKDILSVREIEEVDVPMITDYWLTSSREHHLAMGVDVSKLPAKEEWWQMLHEQIQQPYTGKKSYCVIWQINNEAIGHSNINKIKFRQEAYMHLHIWKSAARKKGAGTEFVKMSLPYFFKNYQLQDLFCEPYALNAAPNRTLVKVGFEFIKRHTTIPGWLNFEQEVSLWKLNRQKFLEIIQ